MNREVENECTRCGKRGTLMPQPFGERLVCRDCTRDTLSVFFETTGRAGGDARELADVTADGVELAGYMRRFWRALKGK